MKDKLKNRQLGFTKSSEKEGWQLEACVGWRLAPTVGGKLNAAPHNDKQLSLSIEQVICKEISSQKMKH